MKKNYLIIIFIAKTIFLTAQAPPLEIDSITVRPDSSVLYSWKAPLGIVVKKWVIYHSPQDQGTFPDTLVLPNSTAHSDPKPKVKPYARPEGVRMAYIFSFNGNDTLSLVSTLHNTIFLAYHHFDTCQSEVHLIWTHYNGKSQPLQYEVYYTENENIDWNFAGQTNDTVFVHQVQFNKTYRYKIIARANNFSSTSNVISIFSEAMTNPDFNHSLSCIYTTEGCTLKFEIDASADLSSARLHKIGTNDSIISIQYRPSRFVYYTDPNSSDKNFSYYLELLDRCQNPVSISDTIHNLNLKISVDNDQSNLLQWNVSFGTPDEQFALIYFDNSQATTIYSGTQTQFSHIPDNQVSKFCYMVESNCIGKETSKSEKKCIIRKTNFYLPKAFTPNNDGMNDIFKPIIQFPGSGYYLSVYNSWGQKVFESTNYDKGWDGEFNNKPSPDGNYLFFLKYTTSDGIKIEEHGEVNLVRP